MSAAQQTQLSGLVKRAVKIKVLHQGEMLMERIFQTTPIRFGRMLDNDLALPFDFVSRYHCELRYTEEGWVAVDLGSKNGFLTESPAVKAVRLERINELKLESGSTFYIQELAVSLELMEEVAGEDNFQPVRQVTNTLVDSDVKAERELEAQKTRSKRDKRDRTSTPAPTASQPEAPQGPRPMLDIDLQNLLFIPHASVGQAREKALQMTTVWHDQVIDTKEFAIGETIVWDHNGDSHDLGQVGNDKSSVRVPKGCEAVEGALVTPGKNPKVTVNLVTPTAFNVNSSIFVYLRYVPKSKNLPQSAVWLDDKLMDPLIISSAIHGTAALASFVINTKTPPPREPEPERFATVIMPTPPVAPTPQMVAVEPTPEPTPVATPNPKPEPTPKPKKVAVKEPEPPKIKKTVDEKKHRKVALKQKVEVAPLEKPKVANLPPAAKAAPAAPVPAPKIVAVATPLPFNAKSFGALKTLSLLQTGPSAKIANVQNIQVSRSVAAVPGSSTGAQAVQGTGDIISHLNQSATGASGGTGDAASGVALGGKAAGGAYQVGGLTGKAGKHKIKGSVLGGATYTELSKNEGLTREQVMKVVQKNQALIQQCYERSLMSNPDLSGSAEFEWEIAGPGNVNFAKVKGASIKNGEGLLDCVKGVFSKMQFPKAKNGENTSSTITLPFGRL